MSVEADAAAQVEQIRQRLEAAIRSEANADASDRCEHYDVLVDSRSSLADLCSALAASQQARQQAEARVRALELMSKNALTRADIAEARLIAQGTTLARLREAPREWNHHPEICPVCEHDNTPSTIINQVGLTPSGKVRYER